MNDIMRRKVHRMLLCDDALNRVSASIVSASVVTKIPMDEILSEAAILIKARIEKAEFDGTLDRLNALNDVIDEFLGDK